MAAEEVQIHNLCLSVSLASAVGTIGFAGAFGSAGVEAPSRPGVEALAAAAATGMWEFRLGQCCGKRRRSLRFAGSLGRKLYFRSLLLLRGRCLSAHGTGSRRRVR